MFEKLNIHKNPIISVIIPVYNSENHLRKCLDSVIGQTLENIEIICVNDGSTDSSIEILNEYSEKDNRIIILDEINEGAGISRKKGLDISKGEYVYFADSDDILEKSLCETTFKNAVNNNSDIVFFKVKYFDTKTKYEYVPEKFDLSNFFSNGTEFENYVFDWGSVKPIVFNQFTNIWNCIFKRDLLKNNDIYFPKKLSFNDVPLHVQSIIYAEKISFVPEVLYNYRLNNENSITVKSHNNKRVFDIFIIFEFLEKFLSDENLLMEFRMEFIEFKLDHMNYHLSKLQEKNLYGEFLYKIQQELKKTKITSREFDRLSNNFQDTYLLFTNSHNFDESNQKINNYSLQKSEEDNNKIKVSIIIPVYNVELYLKSCMDTVINQTLDNIEIICVNDGSTDNSLELLEEYVKKDNRIRIITQKNCGLGCARNTGLKYAKGEYIFFLDSDDKILLNSLEKLYLNATSNNSDFVIFKISRFNDEYITYANPGFPLEKFFGEVDYNNFTFTYKNIKNYVLNASFSAWSKLYKKEFLDGFEDFKFPVGTAYEDVLFHVKCFLRASRISFESEYFYKYRLSNTTSIMHIKSNFMDIFNICDSVEEFLISSNYFDEFYVEFIRFKIHQLSQYILNADSDEYYNKVREEFKELGFNINIIPDNLAMIYQKVLSFKTYKEYEKEYNATFINSNIPISIIIPICDDQDYIPKCLNSILNQKFDRIEIIVIDYGSTDSSIEIVNDYFRKDSRIRLYSINSNTLNEAQDFGLSLSRGDYVYFINSRDWIEDYALNETYQLAKENNLDMIMFPRVYVDKDEEKYETSLSKYDKVNFNPKEIVPKLFNINFSFNNVLIKKEIYNKTNFKFSENYGYSESVFFFKLSLACSKGSVISKNMYHKQNIHDTLPKSPYKNCEDVISITSNIFDIFEEHDLINKYADVLVRYKLKTIVHYYNNLDYEYKTSFFNEMKKDFLSIYKNEEYLKLFDSYLDYFNLTFFENVIAANDFKEFDLMMEIFNKDIEINNLKDKIESQNIIVDKYSDFSELQKELNNKLEDANAKLNHSQELFSEKSNEILLIQKKLKNKDNLLKSLKKQNISQLSSLNNKDYCIRSYKEEINNNHLEIEFQKKYLFRKKILNPLSYLYLILKSSPKELFLNIKLYKSLKNSKCFDIGFYLNNNPDIQDSKWCKFFSPELHYVCNGFEEKRSFNKKYFNKKSKKELLKYISKISENRK